MKKLEKRRKYLSMLIALLMVFMCVPSLAFAEDANAGAAIVKSGTCGEKLTWTLDSNGLLTISGTGKMYDYNTSRDDTTPPWYGLSLTSLVIEEGVTSIGKDAFKYCKSLKSITIPEGVRSIGDSAFLWCNSLTSITLPDSVTSIGDSAFQCCESLTSITLPSRITSISRYMFSACENLTAITIPDSVTSIGDWAFSDCIRLKSINIPDGVTSIGDWAFKDCRLKSITIPEGITSINHCTFYCSGLESITLPDSVTSIGGWAFYFCVSLKSITIPNSVTSIPDSAFGGCSWLTIYGVPDSYAHKYAKAAKIKFERFVCPAHEKIITLPAVEATCTETGLLEGKKCSYCNTIVEKQIIVPAKGHTKVADEAVPSTCTTTGLTEGSHCGICNEVLVAQKEAPVLGHGDWEYTPVEVSQNEQHIKACGRCHNENTTENCTFSKGKVALKPTETEDGVMTYTCSLCKGTYTESIPAGTEIAGVTRATASSKYDRGIMVANMLKEEMGVEKFGTIIVATGKSFPDALGGSYLAAAKSAPILLIDSGSAKKINTYINDNLADSGTVYILGGTSAVSDKWISKKTLRSDVILKRMAGADRYKTNMMILKEVGVPEGSQIMICSGKNYPDSLSVAATGNPVMLVKDSLNATQKTYLKNTVKGESYYVIGGTSAVKSSIEKALKKSYGTTTRIGGALRFNTSVNVAKAFFPDADSAVLAYGADFSDGLIGGPLAYQMEAPLLLTRTSKASIAKAYTTKAGIDNGVVIGPTNYISDSAVRGIFGMNADDEIGIYN